MTATAIGPITECPKCGGPIWDNRVTKTNPKQPDFKCKNIACKWVEWPTKTKPAATPEKPRVTASVPESALPPGLRNTAVEETAELRAKIGEIPSGLDQKAKIAWAQRQSIAIVLDVYEPMFKAKEIGMTDETVHKLSFELFKTWTEKGLIGV